jgi:hypothetical protein
VARLSLTNSDLETSALGLLPFRARWPITIPLKGPNVECNLD